MPARIGKQAVVVGAGMAGLTAARSLADFFGRIIVLENDGLPKEATHRPGTPQSRHLHGLLAGGLQALSRLFPGFEGSLSQAGAVRLRMSCDYRLERPGYDHFPQRDLGVFIFSMTRPLLEFTVRKRLGEYSNIELRLEKFPRALLPFGDAICRFNPIYGQGMSVAALEADVLNGLLRAQSAESDGYEKLAREFFAEAEKLIDTPWSAAAVPDFIDPRSEGQCPADFEDSLKFFAALLKLAAQDPAVHKLLIEVQSLLKPRSAYRDPELVRRINAIMAEAAQAEGSARSASS